MNISDRWIIYHNSEYINTIFASEEYVKQFCKKNNYTYKSNIVGKFGGGVKNLGK